MTRAVHELSDKPSALQRTRVASENADHTRQRSNLRSVVHRGCEASSHRHARICAKAEDHRLPSAKTVLQVSTLADWTWAKLWQYTAANRLNDLPQHGQGYASIGCEPCTALPNDPSNPRSGRWGGKKSQSGIHTLSERAQ